MIEKCFQNISKFKLWNFWVASILEFWSCLKLTLGVFEDREGE